MLSTAPNPRLILAILTTLIAPHLSAGAGLDGRCGAHGNRCCPTAPAKPRNGNITVGDVVQIRKGENHWHGARAESYMSHITITAV